MDKTTNSCDRQGNNGRQKTQISH